MISDGGASLTRMVTVVNVAPPVFCPVIVYVVTGERTVGVPLISPVEVSRTSPVGNPGDTDQEVTVPPLEVGMTGVINSFFVKSRKLGEYAMLVGGISLTIISTVVVPVPPLFVALIV